MKSGESVVVRQAVDLKLGLSDLGHVHHDGVDENSLARLVRNDVAFLVDDELGSVGAEDSMIEAERAAFSDRFGDLLRYSTAIRGVHHVEDDFDSSC